MSILFSTDDVRDSLRELALETRATGLPATIPIEVQTQNVDAVTP